MKTTNGKTPVSKISSLLKNLEHISRNSNAITSKAVAESFDVISQKQSYLAAEIFKTLNEFISSGESNKIISLLLYRNIKHFIDQHIEEKVARSNVELKKMHILNDHLEVHYYTMKKHFFSLKREYLTLKKNCHNLQQEIVDLKHSNNKKNLGTLPHIRNYNVQMSSLSSACCAVYDSVNKLIIIKLPKHHQLVKELNKGIKSTSLNSNSIFDMKSGYWSLNNFELQTIVLLLKSNFTFSKELSLLFRFLQRNHER